MGKDPKTSALNSFCQSHDVKNLFVTDGSCFTTSSEKNPTLTIMALSMRAAEYITQTAAAGRDLKKESGVRRQESGERSCTVNTDSRATD